ncbi:hypothetical protein [Bradyrhizobium sp. STM 3557]|uniref:hypothetical protein n=1 Tax=Bradyrhizobium sp. STM 3557 TaxID=578920 RepID=UPI00388DD86F
MSGTTPIDVIAARIARIALAEDPKIGRLGPGPVLTVVRDTRSGKIYVGLNTGIPKKVSDVLYKAILAQGARIWQGEVTVVRSDPEAVGGHSEVNALNPAIRDRERLLGRKLTEADLSVFELHNLWLSGSRSMTAAPRCEHCARITRGVAVTQSVFVAEGGVVGEINVPQRGSVLRSGSRAGTPVTTASGSIGEGDATEAGNVSATGGGYGGAMTEGLLTAAIVIAEPLIKRWAFKTFMQEKWSAEQRAMITRAIERSTPFFNVLVQSHSDQIRKEKGAGRQVKLRIDVDTEWVDTSFAPAQIGASVSYFDLLFEGDTEVEWPLFQPSYGFWSALFHAARYSRKRETFYIAL